MALGKTLRTKNAPSGFRLGALYVSVTISRLLRRTRLGVRPEPELAAFGDVIRTIRDDLPYIAHFHTAGVPGRHELDQTQELFYPGIARAIADTGFTGYFAHEFIPTRAWDVALGEAINACRV